jgi:hypothetical protein
MVKKKNFIDFINNNSTQSEIKGIIKLLLNMVMDEIKPHIYLTVIFISTIFLLILAIFILQIRIFVLK